MNTVAVFSSTPSGKASSEVAFYQVAAGNNPSAPAQPPRASSRSCPVTPAVADC